MHLDVIMPVAPLLALLLVGCRPDYSRALACEWPATPAPVTPSSAYAGRTIAELESLAAEGDLAAARVLGERYEQGDGVAPDLKEAVRWYRQAAFVPPTTTSLAAPAVGGRAGFVVGVTAGPARPGDPIAMAALGRFYANRLGVDQDKTRAEILTSCAALGGY